MPRDFDPGKNGRGPRAAIPARKRWGQHFLAAPETAERIVDAARVGPGDTVFEVGPGDGALTRVIAARGARLAAVEIDPLRAAELTREFARNPRVAVACGDVLEKSFGDWLAAFGWPGPAVLLANLPYNVATPILTRAIEESHAISRSVATIQREAMSAFRRPTGSPSTLTDARFVD